MSLSILHFLFQPLLNTYLKSDSSLIPNTWAQLSTGQISHALLHNLRISTSLLPRPEMGKLFCKEPDNNYNKCFHPQGPFGLYHNHSILPLA